MSFSFEGCRLSKLTKIDYISFAKLIISLNYTKRTAFFCAILPS